MARGTTLMVILFAGCHRSGAATAAKSTTSCRAVAQAAARFVDGAPDAEREAMLRFAVEVIDLCQAPGLSPTTRKCVAAAGSAAEARACPAIALVPLHAANPVPSVVGSDEVDDDFDLEGTLTDEEDDAVEPTPP